MNMLTKNDCLNELLKEAAAAKCPFLEFIGMILAVIVICVQNGMFSIKDSFHRTYAELSAASENKRSCTGKKASKNQKYQSDKKTSLPSDEIITGRQHNETKCRSAVIDLLAMIVMKLRSLVTKSNTNRLIRAW